MTSIFENDPFGTIKKDQQNPAPTPRDVDLAHFNSDVDSSNTAQHHTIGIKHDQASAGDHIHDGKGTRKLGANQGFTVTGSKGGNAALASLIGVLKNFIEFNDTTT